MHILIKHWFVIEGERLQLHFSLFFYRLDQEITFAECVDNLHEVLIIADDAPIGDDLRGNLFGFNVIDNIVDVSLKGFCFEMFLSKRTEGIYTEYDLAPVLTEH